MHLHLQLDAFASKPGGLSTLLARKTEHYSILCHPRALEAHIRYKVLLLSVQMAAVPHPMPHCKFACLPNCEIPFIWLAAARRYVSGLYKASQLAVNGLLQAVRCRLRAHESGLHPCVGWSDPAALPAAAAWSQLQAGWTQVAGSKLRPPRQLSCCNPGRQGGAGCRDCPTG